MYPWDATSFKSERDRVPMTFSFRFIMVSEFFMDRSQQIPLVDHGKSRPQ